jgi:hypothetical protein
MQVTTITWKEYPECKPEKDKSYYDVTVSVNGRRYKYYLYWNGYNWYDDSREAIINGLTYDNVIAFIESIDTYDPAATTFNFLTALARMRDDIHFPKFKSLATDFICGVVGDKVFHERNGKILIGDSFTLAEIEGTWSEVG